MKTRYLAAAACACLLLVPPVSSAQAARSGPTFAIGGTPLVVNPDAAYDSIHNRYFVVHGHGFIEGILLNGSGTPIASPVVVNASRGAWADEYAQTPRVAFGAGVNNGAGGYLVTWHETLGNFAQVRGRMFNADGRPTTGDFIISTDAAAAGLGSFWTQGAAIAYSSASQEFLVAWMGRYTTTNDIEFMRVNTAGQVLQNLPTRITAGTSDWERDAAVAYNPDADEFYIVYAGYWDSRGYGYVSGQRVRAGSGALVGGQTEFVQTVATLVPSVAYNNATRQYTVGWYHKTRSSASVVGLNVSADGNAATGLRVLSGVYFAYDALDIKYNPQSGDYLLITHGNNPEPWEDAGVSIKADGNPYDNGFFVTHTTDVRALVADPANNDGNFNPRLAVNTSNKTWLAVTSSAFKSVNGQFVASGGSGGGVVTPPPPPPPPPQAPPAASNPRMWVDLPRTGTTVGSSFLVGGWAIDMASTSGPGVDAVHVWGFPVGGGSPIFAGAAVLNGSRPDVAAAFGSSNFATSGFNFQATLPAGTYDVVVYAHSIVANAFNNVLSVRVVVPAPQSIQRMAVDLPAAGQNVSQNFRVAGWALDVGSPTGTGVDAVHVWAYPASGGSPLFVGAAEIGLSRPDVAAAFGAARFGNGGFNLDGSGRLPPGTYTLVIYSHSTITGDFTDSRSVQFRVN